MTRPTSNPREQWIIDNLPEDHDPPDAMPPAWWVGPAIFATVLFWCSIGAAIFWWAQ